MKLTTERCPRCQGVMTLCEDTFRRVYLSCLSCGHHVEVGAPADADPKLDRRVERSMRFAASALNCTNRPPPSEHTISLRALDRVRLVE